MYVIIGQITKDSTPVALAVCSTVEEAKLAYKAASENILYNIITVSEVRCEGY